MAANIPDVQYTVPEKGNTEFDFKDNLLGERKITDPLPTDMAAFSEGDGKEGAALNDKLAITIRLFGFGVYSMVFIVDCTPYPWCTQYLGSYIVI